MATQLAQTAKATRIFFFGAIVVVVAYLIGSTIFSFVLSSVLALRPKAEVPATVGFGRLPKLNFRPAKLTEPAPQFSLETTSGGLPLLSKTLPVYEMIEPKPSYLSLDNAKDLAKRLGFDVSPQSVSSSTYLWEEETRSLKVNIFTQNFLLESDLGKLVIPIGDLPSEAATQTTAKEFLNGKALLSGGLEGGPSTTTLLALENGQEVRAESLADAALIKVNLFRSLQDAQNENGQEYPPLLPPNPREANVQIVFYSPKKNLEPLKIKYANWTINKERSETYPLKTPATAWQELTAGGGAISLVKEKLEKNPDYPPEVSLSQVIIRDVSLAYFDDESLQKYLQPIYVFTGDAKDGTDKTFDFTAYVQAVDGKWVGEQ